MTVSLGQTLFPLAEREDYTFRMEASAVPARIAFYSAHDGRRLAARVWPAAESPRGALFFFMGSRVTGVGTSRLRAIWRQRISRCTFSIGADRGLMRSNRATSTAG